MNISIFEIIVTAVILVFILLFLNLYRPQTTKRGLAIGAGIALFSVAAFYLAYYLSIPINQLSEPEKFKFLHTLGYAGYGWIVTLLTLLIPFLVLAVIRYIVTVYNRRLPDEQRQSRRRFFRALALGLPAVTFVGATGLAVRTTYDLRVNHLDIKFSNLPQYLRGYRIGQVSDSHLGAYFSLAQLEDIFNTLINEKVDRVVITGDLIDDVRLLPKLCAMLETFFDKFPGGIDYIYGNHEYYRNLGAIEKCFDSIRMRVHRNSNMRLDTGEGQPVYLAGVDYPFQKTTITPYLDEALKNIPEAAFVILLAHHPDFITEAFARNIPITLSGHTHGGQINVGDVSLVPMNYAYWRGLYKAPEGNSLAYVNTGAGNWFPVRMNCPREITIVTFGEGTDTNSYNEYM